MGIGHCAAAARDGHANRTGVESEWFEPKCGCGTRIGILWQTPQGRAVVSATCSMCALHPRSLQHLQPQARQLRLYGAHDLVSLGCGLS